MTAGRTRAGLTALLVALALVVVAPAAGVVGPAVARAADPDLTVVTDATYTVRPDDGNVGVSVAMTARNRTKETRTRRFFYDHTFLAVQPGATNLRISGPKGARVKVARRSEDSTLLRDRLRVPPVQRQGRDDEDRLRPARAGTGRQPAGPGGKRPRHAARLGVRVERRPRELGRGAVPARLGRRGGVG